MSAAEHDAILDLALAAFDALGRTEADAYLEGGRKVRGSQLDGCQEHRDKPGCSLDVRASRCDVSQFAWT